MKHGYWKLVNKIISVADVVVEVLDARFPELARVHKLEKFVKNHNKCLILAVNKADLISGEALSRIEKEYSKENFVLLSAKNSKGVNNLIRKIKDGSGKGRIKVAIIGYPNTGKSTLINRLSRHARVPISPESGVTKGLQNISGKEGFKLIDTPGIVPFEDRDDIRLGIISGISPSKLRDPELVAYELINIFKKNNPTALDKTYNIDSNMEADEILHEFGRKNNMLMKGGVVDERRAAIQLLIHWHKGRIRV